MSDFITVEYRNVDGLHVFTSGEVPGLYVAAGDPKEAFECVSEGISLHLRLNRGETVSVEPAISVGEFLQWIGVSGGEMGIPHPAVTSGGVPFRPRAAG